MPRAKFEPVPLEQRVLAVEIVEKMGGRLTNAALDEVRKILNRPTLSKDTLQKWMWSYRNVKRPILPTADRGRASFVREVFNEDGQMVTYSEADNKAVVINEKNELVRLDMVQLSKDVENVVGKRYAEAADVFLERALDPAVVEQMRGLDAMKAAGLAAEIARKSAEAKSLDIPPDIAPLIPPIIRGLQRLGQDPYVVLYNLMIKVNQAQQIVKSDKDDKDTPDGQK